MIPDIGLDALLHATRFVDRELARLERLAAASRDPDEEGIYDVADGVVGLGFVACQQYITLLARKEKALLGLPSTHRCGESMACLINAAANLWKHRPEWNDASGSGGPHPKTAKPLTRLGVDIARDYPLGDILAAIVTPLPVRFGRLVPFLRRWRDEVNAHRR